MDEPQGGDRLLNALRPLAAALVQGQAPMTPVVQQVVVAAEDAVAAGHSAPQALAVAALPRGTTFAEGEAALLGLLEHNGLHPSAFGPVGSYEALREAFGHGVVQADVFEGRFHERLPTVGAQDLLDRKLAVMFLERDRATDPHLRESWVDTMRALVLTKQDAEASF